MNLTLWIVLIVLLVAAFVAARRMTGSQSKKTPQRPVATATAISSHSQFHAVSIKFSGNACEAARAMQGKRFLSSAAPRIPLPECNVLECKCRFVHFKDRRNSDDRRGSSLGSNTGNTGEHAEEQRQGQDRRTDPPDDY